jgi:metal-responsive CopG/Arc/MetJ family transcriptional regulator
MRTTVEIREEHRALLHAIAATRGWRGFSRVVAEAIEFYLQHHSGAQEARQRLLGRRGAWTPEEAQRVREAIIELRRWTEMSSSMPMSS